MMEKERSKGVSFLGFWLIIQGIPFIIKPIIQNTPLELIIDGPIGLISILIGIGILRLIKWVRMAAIIYFAIPACLGLITAIIIFFSQPIVAIFPLIGAIILVSLIYFLTRPKVKEQFR